MLEHEERALDRARHEHEVAHGAVAWHEERVNDAETALDQARQRLADAIVDRDATRHIVETLVAAQREDGEK